LHSARTSTTPSRLSREISGSKKRFTDLILKDKDLRRRLEQVVGETEQAPPSFSDRQIVKVMEEIAKRESNHNLHELLNKNRIDLPLTSMRLKLPKTSKVVAQKQRPERIT